MSCTRELITYIDTQTAPRTKHTEALCPHKIKIINIGLIRVMKTYLMFNAVILQLPVRRRRDYQVNRQVWHQRHLTAITMNECVCRFHFRNLHLTYSGKQTFVRR